MRPLLGWIQRAIGYYEEADEFWFCYKCGNLNPREVNVCGECGEKLLVRMTVEPIGHPLGAQHTGNEPQTRPLRFEASQRVIQTQEWGLKTFGKMFLHGCLFALIFTGFWFAWVFSLLILVSIGSLIGLALGAGFLVLGIGGINAFLGALMWNIPANTKFWNVFLHGLALGGILLVVGLITSFLPNQIYPGTATYIATFIVASFIYGAVGRAVASWFGNQ